jgi:hypothetical protein
MIAMVRGLACALLLTSLAGVLAACSSAPSASGASVPRPPRRRGSCPRLPSCRPHRELHSDRRTHPVSDMELVRRPEAAGLPAGAKPLRRPGIRGWPQRTVRPRPRGSQPHHEPHAQPRSGCLYPLAGLAIIATALSCGGSLGRPCVGAFQLPARAAGSSVRSHCASGRPSARHWCWPAGILGQPPGDSSHGSWRPNTVRSRRA